MRSRRSTRWAWGLAVALLCGYASNLISRDRCEKATTRWLVSGFQSEERVCWLSPPKGLDPRLLFGTNTEVMVRTKVRGKQTPVRGAPMFFGAKGNRVVPFCVSVRYSWGTDPERGAEGVRWFLCALGAVVPLGSVTTGSC